MCGKLAPRCDVVITLPTRTTVRIQEAPILIGHSLGGVAEQGWGLVRYSPSPIQAA